MPWLNLLPAELFKIENNPLNDVMAQFICKRKSASYNLYPQIDFSLPQVKSVIYGLKALRYFTPKMCNIVPSDIKNCKHCKSSRKKNKSWIPGN